MNQKKLSAMRQVLTSRREELEADLQRLGDEMMSLGVEQELERGGLGNHLAEDGSSVTEQERIGTVSDDLREVIRQIDAALGRLDDGTYGICKRCGKPIDEERLEAIPYVEYGVDCQSFLERQHQLYGSSAHVS